MSEELTYKDVAMLPLVYEPALYAVLEGDPVPSGDLRGVTLAVAASRLAPHPLCATLDRIDVHAALGIDRGCDRVVVLPRCPG